MPCVFLAIGGLALWSFRRKEARFEQYTGQFIQGATKHSLRDVEAIRLIREDAGVLARFLKRPVWDAIDFRIPDQLQGIDSKTDPLARNLFTNRG